MRRIVILICAYGFLLTACSENNEPVTKVSSAPQEADPLTQYRLGATQLLTDIQVQASPDKLTQSTAKLLTISQTVVASLANTFPDCQPTLARLEAKLTAINDKVEQPKHSQIKARFSSPKCYYIMGLVLNPLRIARKLEAGFSEQQDYHYAELKMMTALNQIQQLKQLEE